MLPNIHILGIQGSGKGTQSALLRERYGLTYLSSGSLFRERAAVGDSFGKNLLHEMKAGRLISDEQVIEMIDSHLQNTSLTNGLLGDGVIRTVTQFYEFQNTWHKYNLQEPLLIYLALTEEVALQRIDQRKKEQDRPDDNPKAIKARFAMFHEKTEPVISLFEENGRCLTVSADQSVEAIQTEICKAIEHYYPELRYVVDQKF